MLERLGLTFSGETPLFEVINHSRSAEDLGFDSVWVAEHYLMRDAVTTLAAIASGTRNLTLGTGIVSPYTRHIALLAMSAATLSELSQGRIVLGLGTNARFLEQLGVEDASPLTTVRKTVIVFRQMLKGEEVDLGATLGKGGRVKLGFRCSFPVPIYLGAIGPKMLDLAGEIADGVILSAGSSPEYVRKAISRIDAKRGGAKADGEFETVCYITVWKKGDLKAESLARQRLVRLISLPGRETLLSEVASEERIARIREKFRTAGAAEASRLVGDDMLESVSASGTRDKCLEGLDRFRKAGVTLPVLSPIGSFGTSLLRNFIVD